MIKCRQKVGFDVLAARYYGTIESIYPILELFDQLSSNCDLIEATFKEEKIFILYRIISTGETKQLLMEKQDYLVLAGESNLEAHDRISFSDNFEEI